MVGLPSEDSSDSTHRVDSDNHINNINDQRVYFVPFRWWKDAQDSTSSESDAKRGVLYTATPGTLYAGPMKLINNIFNSDLAFNLRKEEDSLHNGENGEVGVSGRDYALVPGEMWLQALKWHSDAKVAAKGGKSFSAAEDDMADVYPLQLRLSLPRETNSMGVRISKKDNTVELFKRACKIFSIDSEQLRIWDFSGQTTLYFVNDRSRFLRDCQRQSDQEIILELQVYGLSDSMRCREGKKDEMSGQHPAYCSSGASIVINGCNGTANSNFICSNGSTFCGRSGEAGSLGLTGLQNLGNTCFMNSAIQCLAHTPKIIDYFLGDYSREINPDNPLGMNGEIASAFGDLLRKLWAPGATPVAPRTFKSKLARFAPQFSGFNQHDSQELLAFLLDGLHEDLNRVKSKPYVEVKDGDDRKDEEVADEYWQNHLARNDSIIVDVCQGQFKSTLVCPECKKVSITFDPFMYLSLPLPSTTLRTMTVTVISTDGTSRPSPFTITVPKSGKFEDLIQALSVACSLGADETLLVAETQADEVLDNCDTSESSAVEDISLKEHEVSPASDGNQKAPDANGVVSPSEAELQFYLTDEKGMVKESQIILGEAVPAAGVSGRLHLLACWPEKYVKQYDTWLLTSLPQIFKSCFFAKRPQESVSLYKCLQAFLMEEPLGPEDMWYCPGCKDHRQASKKLDLWRLPEILVIHLKRFSYSRFLKNKLETYVDFPIDDLDLSDYIAYKNGELSNRYMLYAVSNHYGSMGGGHYTAFVHHGGGRWYEFDDSHVYPIGLEKIKTSAAYLLFYRRVVD
ncbi:Peptidase C19, ubiquitin carboxyl-terminal hydrolase 2 [Corchorus olitorius]|uniref:Ubiquitin carboxyl-terminal hydrolase n=1 Tax=Corchorus olitorius TaxID=93759 RepID=A0A1R3L4G1_9ROSI|nr:Peptidase C19, ubiquitin carboxyl-terminal hydrolase 2 [Corchorus olitorius]